MPSGIENREKQRSVGPGRAEAGLLPDPWLTRLRGRKLNACVRPSSAFCEPGFITSIQSLLLAYTWLSPQTTKSNALYRQVRQNAILPKFTHRLISIKK
jgi:hypothetical protein